MVEPLPKTVVYYFMVARVREAIDMSWIAVAQNYAESAHKYWRTYIRLTQCKVSSVVYKQRKWMDLLANSWLWKTGMQNVNYDQNQFSHYKRLHHGRLNQKIHVSVTWKLFMVVTLLVGSENNWTVNMSLMQISTAGKQTHYSIWLTNKTTPPVDLLRHHK